MKSILFITTVFLVGLLTSCNCQEPDVPQKVSDSFVEMYEEATNVEWEMESENEWEAEFEIDGKEFHACFDQSGNWLETEWVVKSSEIPEIVLGSIQREYKGWEIDEAEFVESPDFIGFEFELEMGEKKIEVLVTEDGQIANVEDDKDDDSDK